MDCSTEDRLGALGAAIGELPLLVIDHHAAGKPFGELRWVRPEAPSVTYMVQLLAESQGWKLSAEEAELALFGLCTDTGFFRHLGPSSAPVFRAAARLVEAGASPQVVFQRIHSGWNLARVGLLAEALRRAERIMGGRGLLTYWSLEDIRSSGKSYSRGSDDVYRLLQAVEGVEVIVFLREEAARRISVGLRSSGDTDVGDLARALGGGGHRNASGCTLSGTLAEARRTVLEELERRRPGV